MRLVRYGPVAEDDRSEGLFDASQTSEAELAATLSNILATGAGL